MELRVEAYERGQVGLVADEAIAIYAEVYADPPYSEGNEQVEGFRRRFVRHREQLRFRVVLARSEYEAIGFAYGYGLRSTTKWWDGLVTDVPSDVTRETSRRTFAMLELAVRNPWRCRHVGRRLHDALLAHRPEERAVLMVHPNANPAKIAYTRWGWRNIGQARPWSGAPLYDAMILTLKPSAGSQ
jgi:ribosomal protein S18 acetylase RimI-like enzyme